MIWNLKNNLCIHFCLRAGSTFSPQCRCAPTQLQNHVCRLRLFTLFEYYEREAWSHGVRRQNTVLHLCPCASALRRQLHPCKLALSSSLFLSVMNSLITLNSNIMKYWVSLECELPSVGFATESRGDLVPSLAVPVKIPVLFPLEFLSVPPPTGNP